MKKPTCPICDRVMDQQGPREWPDWPFCSPKCKLIDLGRWLGEGYRIPTAGGLNDDEDSPDSEKDEA